MTYCAGVCPKNISSGSKGSTIDSEVYYGVITLIELADKDYEQGCSPRFIAEKYNISQAKLIETAKKMEQIQLIKIKDDRLYLPEEPQGLWIIHAVSILKHHFIKK